MSSVTLQKLEEHCTETDKAIEIARNMKKTGLVPDKIERLG